MDAFSISEQQVDFQALIAKQAAPSLSQAEPPDFDIPQRVFVTNLDDEVATVVEIQAQDRIGLLYSVFTTLGNLDAEVLNARICNQAGAAIDRFHLGDSYNGKKSPTRCASSKSKMQ